MHQLKLRQPVVQQGAALCTVNWKGEAQIEDCGGQFKLTILMMRLYAHWRERNKI